MSRSLTAFVTLVPLVLALVACSSPGPFAAVPSASSSGSPDPGPTSDPIDLLGLRYTCGAFPFTPALLMAGPGRDEQGPSPAAAVLRAHLLQPGPDFEFLPDTGWHLTGMDASRAEFVTPGGDLGMKSVGLANGPGGWTVSGWGDCRPRVQLASGLGSAEWAFDPAQPKPDATTQVFEALVTELDCNSGRPADGRIVGPEIIRSADTVLVIFAVRPGAGGAQTCPSNPPTRVRVDLGDSLGDRALLDGGTWPPGDPAKPDF